MKLSRDLSRDWKQICDEYVRQFAEKHEYDIEYELTHDCVWVADNPGTVANIGDMWIDMEDIRYDIDNVIPEEKFEKWYWESLDRAEMNLKYLNYPSFCKGAPDPISPEQMEKIKAARQRLSEAKHCFEESIKDYKTQGYDYEV